MQVERRSNSYPHQILALNQPPRLNPVAKVFLETEIAETAESTIEHQDFALKTDDSIHDVNEILKRRPQKKRVGVRISDSFSPLAIDEIVKSRPHRPKLDYVDRDVIDRLFFRVRQNQVGVFRDAFDCNNTSSIENLGGKIWLNNELTNTLWMMIDMPFVSPPVVESCLRWPTATIWNRAAGSKPQRWLFVPVRIPSRS